MLQEEIHRPVGTDFHITEPCKVLNQRLTLNQSAILEPESVQVRTLQASRKHLATPLRKR